MKETGKKSNIVDGFVTARQVMQLAGQAIDQLVENLNGDFSKALDLLVAVKGRVIVTGMGKSGHVARKIAATMASTGTPAQFVHPGEASHGDLGMITDQDAVIALSNSGESQELSDLIIYTRRFHIPLIAMTKNRNSSLGQQADVVLVLPDTPEACPLKLAPTTSTTSSLVLGDALAMMLLERKGFTASDFGMYHPGGKLGTQLMKAKDLMHADRLPLVDASTKVSDALIAMTSRGFGHVGVMQNKNLIGVITDGDLRRHMSDDLLQKSAQDIMTKNPKVATPAMLAAEALAMMNEKNITGLFVVDDQKPVGFLHIHDCLRAGIV